MLGFIVRVDALHHGKVCFWEEQASKGTAIDTAVEQALRTVPILLSSVLGTVTEKVDTITLCISFERPLAARTLYKLMDKAEAHSLGLFEILDDDDDENIEILPERPR